MHVAESQAQAEDELTSALLKTRHHMVHARATHNPADFVVPDSRVNPWNDPHVSDEDGVRYSLESASLYGAGHVMLAEDLTGKGHTTRVVGTKRRLTATIPLD